MRTGKYICLFALAVMSISFLGGCATLGVAILDRDILAEPSMQLDKNVQARDLDDHIYYSKEAASGGRGFGGGGCGCN